LLKGINKRVIVIRDPDSEMFEEAYFILKAGKGFARGHKEADMVGEASRLLSQYQSQRRGPPVKTERPAGKKSLPKAGKVAIDAGQLSFAGECAAAGALAPGFSAFGEEPEPSFRLVKSAPTKRAAFGHSLKAFLLGVAAMSAVVICIILIQAYVM